MATPHPPPHYKFRDPLSPKFASLLQQSSTRTNWGYGFLLIRTAPFEQDQSLDTLIWQTAMTRLLHNGYDPPPPGLMDYDVLPDLISLPVMTDPSLTNLSPCALRSRYLTWVDDFRHVYSAVDEQGNTINEFEAPGVSEDIKWDHCFLVMNGDSLRSLMAPPFGYHDPFLPRTGGAMLPNNSKRQRKEDKSEYHPWVIAVDTTLPFESSSALPYKYNGDKAPYPGWMRCSASSLEQLWNDMDMLDSLEQEIYPGRTYAGEMPLYTGGLPGRSAGLPQTKDEEDNDNMKGRYKFPVLPGRGIREKEKVEELVKEIEQVTGRKLGHDVCDCLGGSLV
ncbi:hypothetical protein V8F33_003782 [Rhypophila sp. PSN 637]